MDSESTCRIALQTCVQIKALQIQITNPYFWDQARNKSRLQQQEREQEQVDHAVMIRELQTLLAQERDDKERLENKVRGRWMNRPMDP